MFLLSADKNKLVALNKDIITSGSVNVHDVRFQFDSDWDGMTRWAVFRVGTMRKTVELDDTNQCKLPWECVRENDIGRLVQVGVYGVIGETVVLPTIWADLGHIKEGAQLGEAALPPTLSAAEQLLADVLAARDEALAAAKRAEIAAGIIEPEPDPGTGTEDEEASGDVATDDEVNDALDDIFG